MEDHQESKKKHISQCVKLKIIDSGTEQNDYSYLTHSMTVQLQYIFPTLISQTNQLIFFSCKSIMSKSFPCVQVQGVTNT